MGLLHLFSCLKMPNIIKIQGVADKSARNREYISQYKLNVYKDYRDLIDNEVLDCLIISLPNFLKNNCAKYAAEKGVDVFLDKPMARNFEEANEIAHQVEQKGTRLMVGSNYRYHPSVKRIKDLWEEGRIGDVHLSSFELIMNGPFSHPLTPKPVADWYLDPNKSGGGALLDLGYHLIDLNVWFFGNCDVLFSDLQHILHLPVEDASTVVLRSKGSGVISVLNSGWFSKIIFPDFNFRVNLHGTAGFLSSDHFSPKYMRLHAVKEAVKNTLKKCVGKKINYLSYTYYYSSFFKILYDFFDAIKKDHPFPIPLDEELEVMRIMDEIYGKHLTKKEVVV